MDTDYLLVSDGTGDAPLMHITAARSIGATTIEVDTVDNVPAKFIATYGTLLPSGLIDPATKRDFKGHLSGGNIEIDEFEPGSTDSENSEGQVVIIKPNTSWANLVAQFVQSVATRHGTVPAGVVEDFAGEDAPDGWLLCYGQEVDREDYADLFAAIGIIWGSGDNSTTFNVPDLRGRGTAGMDNMGGVAAGRLTGQPNGVNGNTLGNTGGAETHTLTAAQSPEHDHQWKSGSASTAAGPIANTALNSAGFNVNGPTTVFGGGQPHNNVQPTAIMNKIIKT